jgi:hypothetical protein
MDDHLKRPTEHLARVILLVAAIMAFSQSALGDGWPLDMPKGGMVVTTIPRVFWRLDEYDSASSSGRPIYFVSVEDVLDQPGWRRRGDPYCGDFTLTKITEYKPLGKLRYTVVELRNAALYLNLRFPPGADIKTDFQKVVNPGDWQSFQRSKDFHDDVFVPEERGIFAGQLSGLPEPIKLSLFVMACSCRGNLGTTTFKGNAYLAVALDDDGVVYDSIHLNQSARIAKVIQDRLLDGIRAFQDVANLGAIDGLEFTVRIYFKNFTSENPRASDSLEIYVPLALASKFANQEITSQELMDGSVVILNGNRVQVSLTT